MNTPNLTNTAKYSKNQYILSAGFIFVIAFLFTAQWVWHPWQENQYNLSVKLQGASARYWLGTDIYGRDVFSLLLGGICNALNVALISIGCAACVGILLGLAAAGFKGKVNIIIMGITDLLFAFPAILLAIMFMTLLGAGVSNTIVAISLANIPVFVRLTRNTALALLPLAYFQAAKALGRSSLGICKSHLLPNILPIVSVQISIQISLAVLTEAALSYLDIGIQPPSPSLGRMLREAQMLIFDYPMLTIIPGLALVFIIFGFNLLGETLRDMQDLRLKSKSLLSLVRINKP